MVGEWEGRGRALEDEFNEICLELAGDVASREEADEWLGTTRALYHGGPVSWSMTPKIFTPREIEFLRDAAETMYSIMDKVTRRFLSDAHFRSLFHLDPATEELCCIEAGYSCMIPFARVDIFLNEETGDFTFCELNTDGSAGISDAVEITHAICRTATFQRFCERHPAYSTFDIVGAACKTLLTTYAEWHSGHPSHPERPTIAFVDYDESASHDELDDLIDGFAALGVEARFADIHDLHITGEHDEARLVDGVGPIDVVWRRAIVSEVEEKPCEGAEQMAEAARQGLVCIYGSWRTWPCATKLVFAVLWSEAAAEMLTPEELDYVHAHVPRTIVLGPDSDLSLYAEKDRWIAKPAGGFNSIGVLAGLEAGQEEWEQTLRKMAATRGIVQEYAPQYAVPMVCGGRLPEGASYTDMAARKADRLAHATEQRAANNMEGLYLFAGKFSGIYTRCGFEPTIGEWTNRFHMGCFVVDDEPCVR